MVALAIALAVLVGVGIGLGVAFSGGTGGAATGRGALVDFGRVPGLQTGPPPWNDGVAQLSDKLPVLHLDALTTEGNVLHIHQHLDVYVNGRPVTVPQGIGIDDNSFLTELHTHDTSGVIHVESPTRRLFVLGQFFGEWGVRLTANCLGRYCGDLHWWLNGKPQTGDPAGLVLREHQEIAIAVGKPPANIPSSYHWTPGL